MSSRARDSLLVPGRETRRACSIISSGLDPTIIIPKPNQTKLIQPSPIIAVSWDNQFSKIMYAYECVRVEIVDLGLVVLSILAASFPVKGGSSRECHLDDLKP